MDVFYRCLGQFAVGGLLGLAVFAVTYVVGSIVASCLSQREKDRRTVYYDADGTSWEGWR